MHENRHGVLPVLLVEDSIQIRHRLVSLFCESQLVRIVGEAGTIDEALFLLRKTKPEAVVLDMELPDGNGLQLVRFLRSQSPDCHIIILTTYDLPELRNYCAEMGVKDFFNKSIEFENAAKRLHEIARAKVESAIPTAQSDYSTNASSPR
jgi:DNA-binding NarL/FixJ family response regulator